MAFTSGEFRKALGVFPTGVAVVTAREPDGLLQGMTVSSLKSSHWSRRSCYSLSHALC
jgi:flavin reductase (DIM6/NTAB) family NADH-FMN oxidoreductase RutF